MSAAADEQRIAAAAQAVAGSVPVVLCGSRALGTATAGSDWDVLVVVPRSRIPRLLRPLRNASERVSAELGVPVSINPLPRAVLARTRENLFAWKVAREGRVLAGKLTLPDAHEPPRLTRDMEFSYLASAVMWLLEGGDGAQAKAARHLTQLRQLRAGSYTSEPEIDAGDPLPAILDELERIGCPHGPLRRNASYLALSALRGRSRLRAAVSRTAIDCRLLSAATDTLRGRDPVLPPGVEIIALEWPSAHPLLAL